MSIQVPPVFRSLINSAAVVFLGWTDTGGFPEVRAMLAPRARDGSQVFYLTTNTATRHVASLRTAPRACLYFCDQARFRAIAFRGTVTLLQDPESRVLVWRPGDEILYPLGIHDPDFTVIRFKAESARVYADSASFDLAVAPS
ncbi:MAG: pyridoxamine 5'-phosphate oxidase family protein [Bifidobacteriaceae bacterium]|jgi:general stress protein 26|nr:pyridoxamine 5'-phosphate oxidase family protein [Bifidobacteriaceae bacterium]